jgi:phage shock protein E
MLRTLIVLLPLACAAAPLSAAPPRNHQINYSGFRELADDVEAYRETRLIDWDQFVAAAAEPDVLILDARSERQFAAGHLQGAVNLPLPEFSEEALAEIIGRADRPILIYCNNNFSNDRPPVMLKSGRLALNIPTFIHLVGYGYRNVRELDQVVDFNDPNIPWVTNEAGRPQAGSAAQRAR